MKLWMVWVAIQYRTVYALVRNSGAGTVRTGSTFEGPIRSLTNLLPPLYELRDRNSKDNPVLGESIAWHIYLTCPTMKSLWGCSTKPVRNRSLKIQFVREKKAPRSRCGYPRARVSWRTGFVVNTETHAKGSKDQNSLLPVEMSWWMNW